jgi:hypothetical protein
VVDTATNLVIAATNGFVIVEVTSTRAVIKTVVRGTMAALTIPVFPVTLDSPVAPDASLDLTATASHSSKVYNVRRASVLAMLPNNATYSLQLFVWSVI